MSRAAPARTPRGIARQSRLVRAGAISSTPTPLATCANTVEPSPSIASQNLACTSTCKPDGNGIQLGG